MKKLLSFMVKIWNQCYNSVVIRYRKIKHGENLVINGRLRVFGHGRIQLGRDVGINSGLSANPIGGDTCTIFSLKENAVLTLGDGVGISNTAIVCHNRVSIGSRTLIGGGTKIYDTDFHSLNCEERGDYGREKAVTKPIMIGEDVFIGAHSIILKGVSIGNRSIIGAGSVVTKNIPADEVWAGNPARRIRRNPGELRDE